MADVMHPFRYYQTLTPAERRSLLITALCFIAMILLSFVSRAALAEPGPEPTPAIPGLAAPPFIPPWMVQPLQVLLWVVSSVSLIKFTSSRTGRETGETVAKRSEGKSDAWVAAIDRMTDAISALERRFSSAEGAQSQRLQAFDDRINTIEDSARRQVSRLERRVEDHDKADDKRFSDVEQRLAAVEAVLPMRASSLRKKPGEPES